MKSIIKFSASAVLIGIICGFAGCKDGTIGPVGPAGKKGANGAAYDETTKLGNIVFYLSGNTPDGDAFLDTLDFKFSSGNLVNSSYYVYTNTDVEYTFERFLGLNNTELDDRVSMWLNPYVPEGDTTYRFSLILTANITTTGAFHFRINDEYYNSDGTNVTNQTFTGFKHDVSKNTLHFKFNFVVPAASNSSTHDLTVSGVADMLTYKEGEGG